MTDTRTIDVAEIVQMLSADALNVCVHLFPAGHAAHTRFTIGSLAGEPGASLSVHLRGRKPGNWRDFNTNERGDILDLVSQTLYRGSKRDAVQWAKHWLGLEDIDLSKLKVLRRQAAEKHEHFKREAEAQARKMRQAAWNRWGIQGERDIRGTPVELYLNGRGIDLDLVPSTGALRYHPELIEGSTGAFYPAMVAAIVGSDGKFLSCHRTWLDELPGGRIDKADVENPKMSLGSSMGGYISINKGASGKPLSKAPHGEAVILVEGIEDALTLTMAMPERRILATVSLGNMGGIELPPAITTRILYRDNDTEPQALRDFERVKQAHMRTCHDVRVCSTPGTAKDPNEFISGAAA